MSEADVIREVFRMAAVEQNSCRVGAARLNDLRVPRAYFYCVINYTRRRQHKGQHGSRCTRNRAIWIRSVAIEWGLCRWARTLCPPRPEVGRYWGGA